MSKFEAHITCARAHSDTVALIGCAWNWKFSAIDGDAQLGKEPFAYLTAYRPDSQELLVTMRAVVDSLASAGVPVLRQKIERIIYDTKTGVDELTAPPL